MFEILKSTYEGKKIFLTGHTGFKGSWMLAILNVLGANTKGYSLAPEAEPNLYNLIGGDDLCESIIHNILDEEHLKKELIDFQPDFIFHFAAQSLVRKSYRQPLETFDVNILGTANLLNAARDLSGKCNVVIVTTDKVYENLEMDYAYNESDKLGGFDPYSSSKACAEIATASYRQSFFNPVDYDKHKISVATARSGNVIGGGDWAEDRIVPDIVRSLDVGEKLNLRNPSSTRPWQHVLEPLSGYLLLGARMEEEPTKFAQAFNFGPNIDDELSVEELVKITLDQWGSGEYEVATDANAPHEASLLKLDISKAADQLGWRPKMNSTEAINRTVEWYTAYKEGPQVITERQIREYFEAE
ncbi:MAG: CDP-glucose 4,6-dehydratase [Bacteroidetes bacterium]|nr:MAG: CDP-glucose 4,6-dehydratase [Bacteroidota bacterium]